MRRAIVLITPWIALGAGCFEVPDSSLGTEASTGLPTGESGVVTTTGDPMSSASATGIQTTGASGSTAGEPPGVDSSSDTGEPTETTGELPGDCGQEGPVQCGDDMVTSGELCLGAPVEVAASMGIVNLSVFDFDLDGLDDVLVARAGANEVLLLRGTAAGLTNFGTISVSQGQVDVAGGDFNGDGVPDIVTTQPTNGQLVVRRGDGTGSFSFQPSPPAPPALGAPSALGVGDFNDDGRDDVVVVYWENAVVYLTNAEGLPSSPIPYAFPGTLIGGTTVAVFDIDGANGPDFVVGAYDTGSTGVLLNTGGATFADPTVYNNAPMGSADGVRDLRAADVNQDGRVDVLADDFDTGAIYVHLAQDPGGALVQGTPVNVEGSGGFQLADVDDDCAVDLIAHDGSDDALQIYPNRNDGSGTFAVPTMLAFEGATVVEIEAGDFNGDGANDMVVASPGAVFAYLANP
ncbi:MAG: VCBS repeat-containing protein [Myxococcota bacterium]